MRSEWLGGQKYQTSRKEDVRMDEVGDVEQMWKRVKREVTDIVK